MTDDPSPPDEQRGAASRRPARGMMALDDELAAAMAEAADAVSAPIRRRAAALSQRAPHRRPAEAESAVLEPAETIAAEIDLDVLGALDAAISGSWGAAPGSATTATTTPPVTTTPITTPPITTPPKAAAPVAVQPASASLLEDSMFEAPSSAARGPADAEIDEDRPANTATARATAQDVNGARSTAVAPSGDRRRQPPASGDESAGSGALGVTGPASGDATSDAATSGDEPTEAERQAERQAAVLEALVHWMRLIKICAAPRADHGMTLAAARQTLKAIAAVGRAWSAELRGHAWFIDNTWLPVPAAHSATIGELVAALRRARRSGVWVVGAATPEQLVEVTQRFVQCVRGKGADEAAAVGALGFLEPPTLQPNAESWVASIVRRCVTLADLASGAGPFPEDQAMALLDELGQAIPAQLGAVLRTLELRGTSWTAPWAATSTVTLAMATLSAVGTSPRITRGAALAVWALTLAVERGELPPALPRLADRAVRRFSPMGHEGGWFPVAASARGLLRRLADPAGASDGVAALVQLLYGVHAARIAGAGGLLAALTTADYARAAPAWTAALLNAVGPIPIGTAVRLADGQTGLVVDLAGQAGPLRPLVQVGARMVRPDADVALLRPDG